MARELGISLKRLDGWEPRELTRVTAHDTAGRPVAWETRRQPEWDGPERALMLALSVYEAGLCRKCGQDLDETLNPMNDPDRPEATKQWVADGPDECFSCKVLHQAETRRTKESPDTAAFEIWSPILVEKRPRVRQRF